MIITFAHLVKLAAGPSGAAPFGLIDFKDLEDTPVGTMMVRAARGGIRLTPVVMAPTGNSLVAVGPSSQVFDEEDVVGAIEATKFWALRHFLNNR